MKIPAFLPPRGAHRRAAVLGVLLLATASLRADVPSAWNEALLNTPVRSPAGFAPHLEVRALALMHLAVSDAVGSAAPAGGAAETRLAAQRAAVIGAAHDVLTGLLPQQRAAFDALAAGQLVAIPEGAARERGLAAGRFAAAQRLQGRRDDGWTGLELGDGFATPDARGLGPAELAHGAEPPPSPWLRAQPFGLRSVKQFHATEPRTLQHDGEVRIEYGLINSKLFDGVDRAAAIDSAGGCWAQSPPAAWNRLARQLAAARQLDLAGEARVLAVLNCALADATVAALHWRHEIGHWRVFAADTWHSLNGAPPLSTDVAAHIDDSDDVHYVRRETARVLIPPLADYPSLPATVAGAAQAALRQVFRTDDIVFVLPAARDADAATATPRTFLHFSSAAKECAFLSSLDGRHSREACVAGYELGAAVGNAVAKKLSR